MQHSNALDRAVSDVRQAALEISATDQKQAYTMLREALQLQPGHADLLGDLAALHLQAGRYDACIQAAQEALAAEPSHDDSAYAMALALEASGRIDEARCGYLELVSGVRALRFEAAQPALAALCRTKLQQLDGRPAAPVQAVASPRSQPLAQRTAAPGTEPKIAALKSTPTGAVDGATGVRGEDEDAIIAPEVIRPVELGTLLRMTRGIEALTLDCFDTILWRHTDLPTDVFHDLQQRPAFRAAGIDATLRRNAEMHARQLQRIRTGRTEVSLEQIYLAAKPGLDAASLEWLAEDELAAEMSACHAHPGAIRLLREAKARAMPVTIISDTYLDAARLRRLLAHALPTDAYEAIGDVICSCDHGACKSQGLFKLARLTTVANPSRILHVGDNQDADVDAPRAIGLRATHLLHESEQSQQRRRVGAAMACLLNPAARASRMLHMPYRAVLATHGPDDGAATATIGQAGLGPLMHAFAHWIDEEADRLAATRDQVKLIFLMRDAHLPLQAYRELGGRQPAYAAHISRFSAYAASFRSLEHIDHYLAHFSQNLAPEMIARQLLLSPGRTAQLIAETAQAPQPRQAFLAAVRQPEVTAEITAASAAYRARLQRYLQRQADLSPGDTVVLVDLGYAGTIQRVLGPVMSGAWGVDVFGRYLLAVGATSDRHQGLLDRRWLDARALDTIQPYVGLLETLTADDGASVVGYDEHGEPEFDTRQIEEGQHALVTEIQAECLQFVRHAQQFFRSTGRAPSSLQLRDEALACLGRLLFAPSKQELESLSRFKLEINLGSGVARPLFDFDAGIDGLRRHGLFYVGMAQHGARMAVPAELRAAGMEMSLCLLTQSLFGIEVARNDWSMRKLPLTLVVSRDGRSVEIDIEASSTHDGYFSTVVPLPKSPTDIAMTFGRNHAWLQLHSAGLVPVVNDRALERQETDAMDLLSAEGVVSHGAGLLNFESEDAVLKFPAESFHLLPQDRRMAMRLCFRPIAPREPASEAPPRA
jgi:FMN phosphatase YigB (HAD superfamily)